MLVVYFVHTTKQNACIYDHSTYCTCMLMELVAHTPWLVGPVSK